MTALVYIKKENILFKLFNMNLFADLGTAVNKMQSYNDKIETLKDLIQRLNEEKKQKMIAYKDKIETMN